MKTLLTQMLFSWQSLAFFTGFIIVVIGLIWFQRRDLGRQLDTSASRTVHEIRMKQEQLMAEIRDLMEQNRQRVAENQASRVDQQNIRDTVDQVKSQVNQLKSDIKPCP